MGEAELEVLGKFARVKLSTLAEYDGDLEKGCAFLNMYSIYFMICGPLFLNNQACLYKALSYFNSNCAAHFANKVISSVLKGILCRLKNQATRVAWA
jgi:hypothetical protein